MRRSSGGLLLAVAWRRLALLQPCHGGGLVNEPAEAGSAFGAPRCPCNPALAAHVKAQVAQDEIVQHQHPVSRQPTGDSLERQGGGHRGIKW